MYRLMRMGYYGEKSQEEKEKMCRAKCRRGNGGCTFAGLSCLETLPFLPFGLLRYLTDGAMNPLILQGHSPLQKLGNSGACFGVLGDQSHPAATSDLSVQEDFTEAARAGSYKLLGRRDGGCRETRRTWSIPEPSVNSRSSIHTTERALFQQGLQIL